MNYFLGGVNQNCKMYTQRNKFKICKFFLKHKCKYGSRCTFQHVSLNEIEVLIETLNEVKIENGSLKRELNNIKDNDQRLNKSLKFTATSEVHASNNQLYSSFFHAKNESDNKSCLRCGTNGIPNEHRCTKSANKLNLKNTHNVEKVCKQMKEKSIQSTKADIAREIECQLLTFKNEIDQRLHWCHMETVGLKTNQERLAKEMSGVMNDVAMLKDDVLSLKSDLSEVRKELSSLVVKQESYRQNE